MPVNQPQPLLCDFPLALRFDAHFDKVVLCTSISVDDRGFCLLLFSIIFHASSSPSLYYFRIWFQGQELVILEAMKMEYTVLAPRAGTVDVQHYSEGDLVDEGAILITILPSENGSP